MLNLKDSTFKTKLVIKQMEPLETATLPKISMLVLNFPAMRKFAN